MNYKKEYKDYEDMCSEVDNPDYLSYATLLTANEWQEKRRQIISRDGCVCKNCGKGPTDRIFINGKSHDIWWIDNSKLSSAANKQEINIGIESLKFKMFDPADFDTDSYDAAPAEKQYSLHVHHTYYIIENLPWEYPDDSLITLCNWCHSELHEREDVPTYSQANGQSEKIKVTKCTRCNATGHLPEYIHVQGGICFKCHGDRYIEFSKKNPETVLEPATCQLKIAAMSSKPTSNGNMVLKLVADVGKVYYMAVPSDAATNLKVGQSEEVDLDEFEIIERPYSFTDDDGEEKTINLKWLHVKDK